MQTYRMQIRPSTPFGSSLLGEILFGQFCWSLRLNESEKRLEEALAGYCSGEPFLVVSDAFPAGRLPLPSLPSFLWEESSEDLKTLKKREWIRFSDLSRPLKTLRNCGVSSKDLEKDFNSAAIDVPRVALSRASSTASGEAFSPFTVEETFFGSGALFDIYVVLDPQRISPEKCLKIFKAIGLEGFGLDASAGLGKFTVSSFEKLESCNPSDTLLALASLSPHVPECDPKNTFYRVKTHFGRHGALAAVAGNPFKNPVLLAQRGAVISTTAPWEKPFFGKGLKGISRQIPGTVHQAYAPVLPLRK